MTERLQPEVRAIMFVGPGSRPPTVEAKPVSREESVNKINKDREFSLGDLNPLIHPVDLARKDSVGAVKHIVLKSIKAYEGTMPKSIESTLVHDPKEDKADFRFVARFEVPTMTREQMALLEKLVGQRYGDSIRTRQDNKGNKIEMSNYPPTNIGEEYKANRKGWYMGPNLKQPTTPLHTGLYVFKDLGTVTHDNFENSENTSTKYIVEVREAGMKQTDLVSFVTQVSSILGQGKMLDEGDLIYKSYYDLMRLSLKKVSKESLYGLEPAMDAIYRGLITPLASPKLSKGIRQEPESVLEVGVPGTGKTLIVEELLQEDNDVFILPIDPIELQKELMLPKEKQTLLARFAEVSRITGKSIILHVDDIENMISDNSATHSTMLNLMAGVRESGFHIIAATNYPEKIDPALLQPQRFGILLHFPLQDEKARYEILKIHADEQSHELGLPLFESPVIRDIILREVAKETDSFTPRYLAEIVTVAKSNLVKDVVKANQTRVGLEEQNLEGHTFSVEHWEEALSEVSSRYDGKSVKERDEELRRFVRKNTVSKGLGFKDREETKVFSAEVYRRIQAAKAEDKKADS